MYVIWPALRTTSGTSDELSISSWSTEKENSSLLRCATVFDDRSAIDFKPLGPNFTITWLLLSSKFCAGDGEQRAIERTNSANARRVTLGCLEHLRDCEGAFLLACNWQSMVNVIVYNVAFSPVVVSFRQACMKSAKAVGIVGCPLRSGWRMAHEDPHRIRSGQIGAIAAPFRPLA